MVRSECRSFARTGRDMPHASRVLLVEGQDIPHGHQSARAVRGPFAVSRSSGVPQALG
jgi:hypothetical protein